MYCGCTSVWGLYGGAARRALLVGRERCRACLCVSTGGLLFAAGGTRRGVDRGWAWARKLWDADAHFRRCGGLVNSVCVRCMRLQVAAGGCWLVNRVCVCTLQAAAAPRSRPCVLLYGTVYYTGIFLYILVYAELSCMLSLCTLQAAAAPRSPSRLRWPCWRWRAVWHQCQMLW